jgi:hypothetical protein
VTSGLDDEDRAFLTEFAASICYAHPIAAIAFYRAAVDAEAVGVEAEFLMRAKGGVDARSAAVAGRTDALVQTHVVARLLAQLAAAIEDCGALGDAIRHRKKVDGIFRRYLRSQGGAVGDFWDLVLRPTPLPTLLGLPELDRATLGDEDRQAMTLDYDQLALALADVAGLYRGRSTQGTWSGDETSADADVIHIVVDVMPGGSEPAAAASVSILEAYNKVKHRFALFDHVIPLAQAVGAKGDLAIVATYPRAPSYGERLLQNIANVAKVGGETAALVLRLDELDLI